MLNAEHVENGEVTLVTDLDGSEIYLPTTTSPFDELQIDDSDVYSLLVNYGIAFSSECVKMYERFAID